jgi:membrane peptidoglycan carboxypeptidase
MRSTSAAAGRVLGLLSLFLVASVVAGALLAGLFVPAVAAAGGATRGSITWFNDLKAVPPATQLSQQSVLLAKDGTLIARFYNENRSEVPLSKISRNMQNAIIAIEDARFRDHGGVDPIGLVRAAASDYLGNGTEVQGASTLTQQYIKNLYLEQAVYAGDKTAQEAAVARDANRKILEIRAAIDLEKTLTKDEILERYLNIAYFGNNAYGVEAAAELYFSVSAAKLSVVQAALLAGIVQSPDTYDPFRHKTNSLARRNTVLSRMHELGMLKDADYRKAVTTKITLKRKNQQSGCIAAIQGLGFFCQYVRNLIASGTESFSALGSTRAERINALDRGGLRITTSVDLKVQAAAQKAIAQYVKIGDRSKAGTAAVTVEPGTGHVLAMAENKTYSPKASSSSTEINYAVDSSLGGSTGFQTGSTFKAFTLATWLKEGKALNDVIDSDVGTLDNPDFTECNGRRLHGRGDLYKPQNSEPTEGGKMRVLDATANSVNTAFVAMSQQLELCQIAATAKSLGVHMAAPRDYNCSQTSLVDIPQCIKAMTLGPFSISPLTMATAYATFAADGTYCPAFPVVSIKKSDGKTVPVKAPPCKQDAIDPDIAHGVTYALKRVITNGTATDVNGMIKAPVAGKTGTTDNSVDTWFVGYTHARATAVWVGDNPTVASGTLRKSLNRLHVIGGHDYGGQSIFGATIAAPIWAKIMQVAVPGSDTSDWPDPPSDMLGSSGSDVPDVTGKSISDAIGILSGAGFSPRVGSAVDSNVPAGQVASTSPGSGATANQGATVTIHPSNGNGGGPTPAKQPTPPKKKKRHGPPPRL